jgi:hypothetical protein
MKKHEWIHLGIRPYACNQCSCTYTRSDKLRNHMHRKHGEVARGRSSELSGVCLLSDVASVGREVLSCDV